jgi:uncharacterized membrane-anchored protein YhcB (DUF1043 family)
MEPTHTVLLGLLVGIILGALAFIAGHEYERWRCR